jgi:hypothetical protein
MKISVHSNKNKLTEKNPLKLHQFVQKKSKLLKRSIKTSESQGRKKKLSRLCLLELISVIAVVEQIELERLPRPSFFRLV